MASSGVIQMLVLVSELVWATINTLIPWSAKVEKMRRFTPMTPTMAMPDTFTIEVLLIDDNPLTESLPPRAPSLITVPLNSGWNVFLI